MNGLVMYVTGAVFTALWFGRDMGLVLRDGPSTQDNLERLSMEIGEVKARLVIVTMMVMLTCTAAIFWPLTLLICGCAPTRRE